MIDQENSSAWGQEGFESAAPLAYNYPLSPKPGAFHMPVGAAVLLQSWGIARENTSVQCTDVGRNCPWIHWVSLLPELSFGLGSVRLRSLCAEWCVLSGCERTRASPSPASIAPCVANSAWCLARVGSFEAASLKKLKEN